jgi:hypothetical protein
MGYRLGVKGEIQIFSGVDGPRLYHVRTCEISPYCVEREGSSFHAAAFEDSGAVYIRYGSSNA